MAGTLKPRAVRGGGFRAHARRTVRLRATLTHIALGWQRQVEVMNLGLGGACISLGPPPGAPGTSGTRPAPPRTEAVHLGDDVSLSFVAPTLWDPLVIRARVVWVDPTIGRTGVAFEHKSRNVTLALFELVGALGYEP